MAVKFEGRLLKLLSPHTDLLLKDFGMMYETLNEPGVYATLSDCMKITKIPLVRRYCAFLMRKNISKENEWNKVSSQVKQKIKRTVLELLKFEIQITIMEEFIEESEQYVLCAIIELIAAIAKYELCEENWPELMPFLKCYINNNNPNEKEVGLYVMSIVTASTAKYLKQYFKELFGFFSKSLDDRSSPKVQFFTILCIMNFLNCKELDKINLFQNLVPLILEVIRNLAITHETQASKAMEIFDSFMLSEASMIRPYIKHLIEFCCEIASNQKLRPNIRIKTLDVIKMLIRLRKSKDAKNSIVEIKLIPPILDVLFFILYQLKDDNDDDLSVSCMANDVIGIMTLYLPHEQLMPPIIHHIEAALKNKDRKHWKAAYMALGAITMGCSDYIKTKGLVYYVQIICQGMQEKNSDVRNAAVYCLGQFAIHLQPDINKHTLNLLPVLLNYLETTSQFLKDNSKAPPSLMVALNTLKTFCVNLDDNSLPNLTLVMDHLLLFLDTKSTQAKELSIGTIESIACTGKGNFAEYFSTVIKRFQNFVYKKSSPETKENISLKMHAIDTLCMVAGVKTDVFSPSMAHECFNLGITLLDEVEDPNLRRSVYDLFSTMSHILKSKINLSDAIDHMLKCITSPKGIEVENFVKDNPSFTIFEDFDHNNVKISENRDNKISSKKDYDEEDYDNGEICIDIFDFKGENPYMVEKEAAFSAMQEIFENSKEAFLPLLDLCFTEINNLGKSPSVKIRIEVICTLGQFCIILNQISHETGSSSCRDELEQKLPQFRFILFETVKTDKELPVVLICFKTLQRMLDNMKDYFITEAALDLINVLIKDVFQHKLPCQDFARDKKSKHLESEYDELIFEFATLIILSLVKTVPWNQFKPTFANLLPHTISKIKLTRFTLFKSSLIGILGQIISKMEHGASKSFIKDLLPVFLEGMNHNYHKIRSNAVFGLGNLIQNADEALYNQYPFILRELSSMLKKERNLQVQDNLCSVIAKMIITNMPDVPLKKIFPLFLQHLPLKADIKENIYICQCLEHLHKLKSDEFIENILHIMKVLSEILIKQKIDEATKSVIVNLLKSMRQDSPSNFKSALSKLPQESADALHAAME